MDILASNAGLSVLFVVVIAIGVTMQQKAKSEGGTLLDLSPLRSRTDALLQAYTDAQREAHIRITSTHDSAFPFAYGLFLSALVWRLAPEQSWWCLPIIFAGVLADYLENYLQIRALRRDTRYLALKFYATSLKFAALLISLATVAFAFASLAYFYFFPA
jgi:hypothetical protein